MVRKYGVQIMLSLFLIAVPSAMARTWTYYATQVSVGPSPSLVLLNGSQPVVSGYTSNAYQMTPMGWILRSDIKGYNFAGDGGTTIVSNGSPVKYGKDGRFYSTVPLGSVYGSFIGTTLVNGSFVENRVISPTGYPNMGVCSADSQGEIFVASGPMIGTSTGDSGYIGGSSIAGSACDMSVSDFGDIAVSMLNSNTNKSMVCWYDYDKGAWGTRELGTINPTYSGKVAVEFDSQGNLGVAYFNGADLHYAYYDFEQDYWEDEYLKTLSITAYGLGAALAFNQYDLPVIAAGTVVAYDPVPEPVSVLIFGLGVLGIRFRRFLGM
jgi:hypothetical protein